MAVAYRQRIKMFSQKVWEREYSRIGNDFMQCVGIGDDSSMKVYDKNIENHRKCTRCPRLYILHHYAAERKGTSILNNFGHSIGLHDFESRRVAILSPNEFSEDRYLGWKIASHNST